MGFGDMHTVLYCNVLCVTASTTGVIVLVRIRGEVGERMRESVCVCESKRKKRSQ